MIYPLLAVVGLGAFEPDFNPLPGSEWLPRKSVQWPIPASGYVPRAEKTRLCLSNELVMEATPSSLPADTVEILAIATAELNKELARAGGRQLDCLRENAEDTGTGTATQLISKIKVQLTSTTATLNMETKESYELEVSATGGIVIEAGTVYGARHGLTTVLNMLEVRNFSPPAANVYGHTIPAGDKWHWVLPYDDFKITDEPRLSHRGLMIDTARHYQEWNDLYKVVEGLSRSKMNVLHWHATDDQSFPLVLTKSKLRIHGAKCVRGDLTGQCRGAYNPYMTYHQEDIVDFIRYAKLRGVRIYIEIDQPSHARSWANMDTSLRTCDDMDSQVEGFCVQPICGPLNLKSKYAEVRALADSILEDWIELTGDDNLIHIGMDEIGALCWGEEERDRLSVTWLGDSVTAINRLSHNKAQVAVWQDGLEYEHADLPQVASKVWAQVWDDASKAAELLEAGRDIIWSNYAGMYLDCGRGNTAVPTLYSWCDPYKSWWNVYKQTPDHTIDYDSTSPTVGKIRGGEVALWAEQADNANIQTLLWPRVAAWGGASWENRTQSPQDPTSIEAGIPVLAAQHQLASLSNVMAYSKGIRHTPMFVQWCIYEDEKLCDHFTNSFYDVDMTKPKPNPNAAPTRIAQFVLSTTALAFFTL